VNIISLLTETLADSKRIQTRSLKSLLPDLSVGMAAVEETLRAISHDLPKGIAGPVSQLVDSGGKRLRPMVCLLSYFSLAENGDRALPVPLAAAVELVHTASLLHDDVVDEGTWRRGEPAPRLVWGNAASVLGGDYLLARTLRIVAAWGDDAILTSLIRVMEEMARAEAIQLSLRGSLDATEESYFQVIRGKTASLFAWCAEAGARSAGAEPREADALFRFGGMVGECFQMIDDILDLEGDSSALGKNVLSDIQDGKITLPLIVALKENPDIGPLIQKTQGMGAGAISDLHAEIQRMILSSQGIPIARETASKAARQARTLLAELPSSAARDSMEALVDLLLHRSS